MTKKEKTQKIKEIIKLQRKLVKDVKRVTKKASPKNLNDAVKMCYTIINSMMKFKRLEIEKQLIIATPTDKILSGCIGTIVIDGNINQHEKVVSWNLPVIGEHNSNLIPEIKKPLN